MRVFKDEEDISGIEVLVLEVMMKIREVKMVPDVADWIVEIMKYALKVREVL